ncbi:hypothetical protein ABT340_39515 [Streptosporangium sp. NPDC000239]|uniref:hypothetical protein n=1 Tax=Streptosporangium sp. NPDC000239 TaxID=3154248 RepID=UPI0033176F1B
MGNVILGGLLAIIGGIVGTLLTHWLQIRREERARHYEQRRTAHLEFARRFNEIRAAVADSDYTQESPSMYDYRVTGDLPLLFLTVRVFASPATRQAASVAIDRLHDWIGTDGKADDGPLNAAFEQYLRLVRQELGVQGNPAVQK